MLKLPIIYFSRAPPSIIIKDKKKSNHCLSNKSYCFLFIFPFHSYHSIVHFYSEQFYPALVVFIFSFPWSQTTEDDDDLSAFINKLYITNTITKSNTKNTEQPIITMDFNYFHSNAVQRFMNEQKKNNSSIFFRTNRTCSIFSSFTILWTSVYIFPAAWWIRLFTNNRIVRYFDHFFTADQQVSSLLFYFAFLTSLSSDST